MLKLWEQVIARWTYKPPVVWSDEYCRHLLAKGSIQLVSETCSPLKPWHRVLMVVGIFVAILAGLAYGVYGK